MSNPTVVQAHDIATGCRRVKLWSVLKRSSVDTDKIHCSLLLLRAT